jgi:hypothetical protein
MPLTLPESNRAAVSTEDRTGRSSGIYQQRVCIELFVAPQDVAEECPGW